MRAYRKRRSSVVKEEKPHHIDLESFLEKMRNCSNCKAKPKAFLMVREEKIGLREEHGKLIFESDVEW